MDARNTSGLIITTPTDREIVLTRSFAAPRGLVFEAWTKPKHITQWWGCWPLVVCEIDLRVGGAWRYVMRTPNGEEHGFHGVYREIVAPVRLVHTYTYEPMPQHGALNTVLFEERTGRTTVIEIVLHQTKEARDGHLHSGLEAGAAENLNRLEAYLETMKS
ncbi:MAG: SRPBCC family protein [Pseudorhodoplanes sp.]|nr:SRPBCC family protein [Pseudorhodoplanes sp.]